MPLQALASGSVQREGANVRSLRKRGFPHKKTGRQARPAQRRRPFGSFVVFDGSGDSRLRLFRAATLTPLPLFRVDETTDPAPEANRGSVGRDVEVNETFGKQQHDGGTKLKAAPLFPLFERRLLTRVASFD